MSDARRPSRRRGGPPTVSGIVNLYKPRWESSAQYVYKLRGVYGERKVGHAGTLDPFADGVVIGCIGRGTKLVEQIMTLPKSYHTTLQLGVTNGSFDPEQPFEPVESATPCTRDDIEAVLTSMRGEVDQAPPAFSAIKIDGRASYKLARKGDDGDRPTKRVMIYRNEIVRFEWPRLELEITCGKGTYIRAIARDVGKALGCGAVCETLTRTAVGPFRMDESLRLGNSGKNELGKPGRVFGGVVRVVDEKDRPEDDTHDAANFLLSVEAAKEKIAAYRVGE